MSDFEPTSDLTVNDDEVDNNDITSPSNKTSEKSSTQNYPPTTRMANRPTPTTAKSYMEERKGKSLGGRFSKFQTAANENSDESDGEGDTIPSGKITRVKEYVSVLEIPKHIALEGVEVGPNISFPPPADDGIDCLDEEVLTGFDYGADDDDNDDNNDDTDKNDSSSSFNSNSNTNLTIDDVTYPNTQLENVQNNQIPTTPTANATSKNDDDSEIDSTTATATRSTTTLPPTTTTTTTTTITTTPPATLPPASNPSNQSGGDSGLGQIEDQRRQARLQALLLAHQAAAMPTPTNPRDPGYIYVRFMSKEWWGGMLKVTVSSYFVVSAVCVTLHTGYTSSYYNYQFYPSMVSLSSSKTMYLFVANFVISLMVFIYHAVISFFLGKMTHNEEQNIGDTLRYSITETCIALTMFREEVSLKMGLGFLLLLLNKCLHLAAKIRVEGLAQADELNAGNAEVANAGNGGVHNNESGGRTSAGRKQIKEKGRLVALICILFAFDLTAINYYVDSLLEHGASVSILFAFESVVLSISCYSTFCFLILYLYEKLFYPNVEGGENNVATTTTTATQQYQQEQPDADSGTPATTAADVPQVAPKVFHSKSSLTFLISFFFESLRFLAYIVFFLVVFTYYGLPLNIIRDLYLSFTSLRLKLKAFLTYRTLTSNMSARFPSATKEQLIECDHQCIICRDDMPEGRVLPCGHIFHFTCLRQWLQTSGTCPTCRAEIPLTGDIPVGDNGAVEVVEEVVVGAGGVAAAADYDDDVRDAGVGTEPVANDVIVAATLTNVNSTPADVASSDITTSANANSTTAASSDIATSANASSTTAAVDNSNIAPPIITPSTIPSTTSSTPSQPTPFSPNESGGAGVDFQAMQQQIQQQMMTTMAMMCSPNGKGGPALPGITLMPSTPLPVPNGSSTPGLFSPMMSPFAQQSNVKSYAANVGPFPCLCRVLKSSTIIYSSPTTGDDDSASVRTLACGVTVVCIEKIDGFLKIPGGFVKESVMEYLPVSLSGGILPGLIAPYNLMSPVVVKRGSKAKTSLNTPGEDFEKQEKEFNRSNRENQKMQAVDYTNEEVKLLKAEVANLRAEVLKLSQSS